MKLQPGDGGVEILFASEEAGVLKQLVHQLIMLLESHSRTALDPDPLFASLEIGGSDTTPADPALARLLPDAFADAEDAAGYRRVTEQGLINRKLQDALQVIADLTVTPLNAEEFSVDAGGDPELGDGSPVPVNITPDSFPAWARTVTALRLAMAARIGLEREEDYDRLIDADATRGTVLVYDWLAALLEAVVALGHASDSVDEA
ncbi:DUF2017 family protein [Leucobacter sp. G161]|uniref:DUF2017 family protein n=1 Tax=Leucobacter sp. G161 TaxID=663704 RepID=UPI00073C4FD8|nr:DUF2017 family protein [Leucobacter sp. G161]KUF06201.1 hypothetical protein AUL38_02755 [Leucobacter sp. G161]